MTTYKCSQCSGHWTEGPTRNYCETEQCRKCANARIRQLEATPDGGWFLAWETADKDRQELRARVEELERLHRQDQDAIEFNGEMGQYQQAQIAGLKARIRELEAELSAKVWAAHRVGAEAALRWAWLQSDSYRALWTLEEFTELGLEAVCGEGKP